MATECSITEQNFIEKDLCTAFSPEFLRKTVLETGLMKRERKTMRKKHMKPSCPIWHP
jgi:hypothetical protein